MIQNASDKNKEKIRKIDREYSLKCLVDVIDKPVEDVNSKGEKVRYYSTMIYLIPQQSTEQTQFFDAWLPAVNRNPVTGEGQWPEIAVMIGHPINGAVRGAVQRKDPTGRGYPHAHHIVVMTGGEAVEDVLKKFKGKYLLAKVAADSKAESLLT